MANKNKNINKNKKDEVTEDAVEIQSNEATTKANSIAEGTEKKKETQKSEEMVTIPLADFAAQLEELDHLNQKADEFSDGWQRERAEFANYRKRMSREMDMQKTNFKVDIIKKYLTVKDDLERALNNLPEALHEEAWIDGIQLINQKLSNILEGEGIEPIPAEGLAFDPALHEAISLEDSKEVESGFIIEVVQQGYMIGERVIRPAQVRVSK